MCLRQTLSWESRDYRDLIAVSEKLQFQNVSVTKKTRSWRFQIPSVWRVISKSFVFVWTVGLYNSSFKLLRLISNVTALQLDLEFPVIQNRVEKQNSIQNKLLAQIFSKPFSSTPDTMFIVQFIHRLVLFINQF